MRCLKHAARVDDPDDLINPVSLANPLSPDIAADLENVCIDVDSIYSSFEELSKLHERILVEGAGGILVPITDTVSMVDLAARFSLPILIVARAALGTINQTRMTIEALLHRNLPVLGVVYNQTMEGAPTLSAQKSPASVERHTGVPTLGRLPYASHLTAPGEGTRGAFAEDHLDLTTILGS